MKKRFLIPAILLIAALGAGIAHAVGGTSSDPLVSLQYLQRYSDDIYADAEERIDLADDALRANVLAELQARFAVLGISADAQFASSYTEQRLKEGDQLIAPSGTSVMSLAGTVILVFDSGAVVDATTGKAVTSGTVAAANHRYLVAEDTTVRFTVTSPSAVVEYAGYYALAYSSDHPDYDAIASALKQLSLLRGSGTAFGSGFDLENAPTRGAAMIMFIRMLGEEEEALAYTGDCPFTDVDKNSVTYPYVAYAYAKGYTNGYGATTFRPKATTNARQYTEFILRAMGYSSFTNSDLDGTLANAVQSGVITAEEKAALESGTFLRSDLVYLSFYALQAELPESSNTLADQLMARGVFTSSQYRSALQSVTSERIH